MNRKYIKLLLFLMLLCLSEIMLGILAQQSDLTNSSIQHLIQGMANDNFQAREESTRLLIKAGMPVIPVVVKAAVTDDPELGVRLVNVLVAMTVSDNSFTARDARLALQSVSQYRDSAAVAPAKKALCKFRASAIFNLRRINAKVTFGANNFVEDVILNSTRTFKDADLAPLVWIPEIKKLDLGYTEITDDSLAYVSELKELEWLVLAGTKITDEGMKHLCPLVKMKKLYLGDIGDKGLQCISEMKALEILGLGRGVTDKGIETLRTLKNLSFIDLISTSISRQGVEILKKTLTDTEIRSNQ